MDKDHGVFDSIRGLRGILGSSRAGRLRFLAVGGLLGICLVATGGKPVVAEEPAVDLSNEACLGCHDMEDFAAEDGKSLYINGQEYEDSIHGSVDCTGCHTDAEADPHDKLGTVGLDTCATCHDEIVPEYQRGIHGKANSEGVAEAASCKDCHGDVHTAKPSSDEASPAHWRNQSQTCANCHNDTEMAVKFKIPVVRPVEAYLKSVHAAAVAQGRTNGDGSKVTNGKHGATCADCHGTHEILPNTDPESSIYRSRVPATCGACHEKILAEYNDSVHGVALQAGNRDSPVCTDCHGEHRISETKATDSPVFAANLPRETCGRCHSDPRLAEKYGIGSENVSAFEDSFHGLALRSGRANVANCASCHGFHGIRKSSDPQSSVNENNLAQTCGKCHPGAGKTFKLGPVHHQETSTSTILVGWVRWIYLWLIGVVIGGMVAHNLLDWLRKSRHPEPHVPFEGEIPERMPRTMRRQHAIIMITFPLLVYTGFALKYPEAWWATPLLLWEDRIALRGWIHRICGVIMILGFSWHLVYIVYNAQARACMLRMLPRFHDFRAAIGTIAWYFGLRKSRPFSGVFNYAEKAEYWAFLWGTVLMTVTGILLWAGNLTLRYLPGWVADVATALHFYEAILATLAILVWHMYWVIFDPEVYPMDWSWWTGKAPASRAHERSRDDG